MCLCVFMPRCDGMEDRKRQNSHKTKKKKINSMVWVSERTIPTERPPLVGEVIANLCGYRVPRGQRDGSLRPYYSRFSRQEPLLFYQVAPQLYSRGWVDPFPDPLLFSFFFFFSLRKSRIRILCSNTITREEHTEIWTRWICWMEVTISRIHSNRN
jgi:hypothetical protein